MRARMRLLELELRLLRVRVRQDLHEAEVLPDDVLRLQLHDPDLDPKLQLHDLHQLHVLRAEGMLRLLRKLRPLEVRPSRRLRHPDAYSDADTNMWSEGRLRDGRRLSERPDRRRHLLDHEKPRRVLVHEGNRSDKLRLRALQGPPGRGRRLLPAVEMLQAKPGSLSRIFLPDPPRLRRRKRDPVADVRPVALLLRLAFPVRGDGGGRVRGLPRRERRSVGRDRRLRELLVQRLFRRLRRPGVRPDRRVLDGRDRGGGRGRHGHGPGGHGRSRPVLRLVDRLRRSRRPLVAGPGRGRRGEREPRLADTIRMRPARLRPEVRA